MPGATTLPVASMTRSPSLGSMKPIAHDAAAIAARAAEEPYRSALAVAFRTEGLEDDPHDIPNGHSHCRAALLASASQTIHYAADINQVIGCGGIMVCPGDVLLGDDDGVVVIPRHLAAKAAKEAVEKDGEKDDE